MTNNPSPVTTPVLVAIGAGVVIAGLAGVSAVTALQRPQPAEPTQSPTAPDQGLRIEPAPAATVESQPTPVVTPTVAASPLPTPTPTPAATLTPTPTPDGVWMVTRSVAGYTHWNFRQVPNGKVVGFIPFEVQLFSDRRRQDGWVSVLCPPEICQYPTWGWVNASAVMEVKR